MFNHRLLVLRRITASMAIHCSAAMLLKLLACSCCGDEDVTKRGVKGVRARWWPSVDGWPSESVLSLHFSIV